MQIRMDFGNMGEEASTPGCDPTKTPKESLTEYIKVCGLVKFKDYFMAIKEGKIDNIPPGLTRGQFLLLCREVYETRAKAVDRQDARASFFRIKNTMKRR